MKVEVIQDCVIYPDGVTKVFFSAGDIVNGKSAEILFGASYAINYVETRVSPPTNTPEKKYKYKKRVKK